MSNFIVTQIGPLSTKTFTIKSINLGDRDCHLEITSTDTLKPGESIRFVAIKQGHGYSNPQMQAFLEDPNNIDDNTLGMYYATTEHQGYPEVTFPATQIKIPITWENTPFDIYWLDSLGEDADLGAVTSGIFTFPRNPQPSDITVYGNIDPAGTGVQYVFTFTEIVNANHANYAATGPYWMKVAYRDMRSIADDVPDWSAYKYYPVGSGTTGVGFPLYLYDPRDSVSSIPAKYNLCFKYYCASALGGIADGSRVLTVILDHSNFILGGSFSRDLTANLDETLSRNQVVKVGEVKIDPQVIERKRISLRIEDIVVKENIYAQQGTYISDSYSVADQIYTFSLDVKEFVPDIEGFDKYNLVTYDVQFNGLEWYPISPITRLDEKRNDKPIPKMFIFDRVPEDSDTNVKYLEALNINTFRIRINFNMSQIPSDKFVPPEIHGFKCMIFDKSKFLEL